MPRKMQRKWEGMMTSPSISKGKYTRLPDINHDGCQSLTFPSLTFLRLPVQPEGEGSMGESCCLFARRLRPV